MTVLVWFRRDLRLADHGPLMEAARRDETVVPLFVLDPRLLAAAGSRRSERLHAAVARLSEDIREAGGTGLLVVHGDPRTVVPAVAREHRVTDVLISEDHAPYGRARDAAVAEQLQAGGTLLGVDSPYLHRPGAVRKPDGSAYSVFTPYYRAWRAAGLAPPLPAADVRFAQVSGQPLPGRLSAAAGERHARQLLDRFVRHGLHSYGTDRNRPDLGATSGLSAALHFGEIHPRTVVAAVRADADADADAYVRQLCWRDFYADFLRRRPEAAHTSVDPRWDAFGWRTDERALQDFGAWCHGRTGYPFVDAGMRQLLHTGWMHNRVRMVTASFLTKDLQIPWQWGARWFARHLVDGDVANNSLGWQWVAGSGLDPAPYHRVFNPVTQGLRFDPTGAYVRRYVPELKLLPGPAVHEPWAHPVSAPQYPERMLDHAAARAEALAAHAALTGR